MVQHTAAANLPEHSFRHTQGTGGKACPVKTLPEASFTVAELGSGYIDVVHMYDLRGQAFLTPSASHSGALGG